MKIIFLTLFLFLNYSLFSQEVLNDNLIISTEKLMRKGEWCHLEIYGYDTYDCNRRFFYKCHDKVELDTIIIELLFQYEIDTEDEGQYMKSDKGDMCHMWQTTQDEWEVTIHTYKNQYDKWMIYIRFD
jgi:hypothetical protein